METPLDEWAWDTATHAQLPPNSQLESTLSEWVGSVCVCVCVFETGFVLSIGLGTVSAWLALRSGESLGLGPWVIFSIIIISVGSVNEMKSTGNSQFAAKNKIK